VTWASTVRSVTYIRVAIALLERPRRQGENLPFAPAQLGKLVLSPPPADQTGDDRRVDDGLALVDSADRVDQNRCREHALFEEVADALGMGVEQAHGVVRLDVLDSTSTTCVRRPRCRLPRGGCCSGPSAAGLPGEDGWMARQRAGRGEPPLPAAAVVIRGDLLGTTPSRRRSPHSHRGTPARSTVARRSRCSSRRSRTSAGSTA
jgi:hypothetical protein